MLRRYEDRVEDAVADKGDGGAKEREVYFGLGGERPGPNVEMEERAVDWTELARLRMARRPLFHDSDMRPVLFFVVE